MRRHERLNQEMHALMLIAAILSLLSLIGFVLSITSGLITAGVDGVFLVLVCLMTGTIFGLLALSMAVQAGYVPVPARFQKAHK
jgi:hypothetical protein